ncbi:hypothetical protein ACFL20_09470, partial [Spirochaetota bacterium]
NFHGKVEQVVITHDRHSHVKVSEKKFAGGGKIQFCRHCNWKLKRTVEDGKFVYTCPKETKRLFGTYIVDYAHHSNPKYHEFFKSNPSLISANFQVWLFNRDDAGYKKLIHNIAENKWLLDGYHITFDKKTNKWLLPKNKTINGVDLADFKRDPQTLKWSYKGQDLVFNEAKGVWEIEFEGVEVAKGSSVKPLPMPLENTIFAFLVEKPKNLTAEIGKDRLHPDRSFVVKRIGKGNEIVRFTSHDALLESNTGSRTWIMMNLANMAVATAVFIGAWLVIGLLTFIFRFIFDKTTSLSDTLIFGGYGLTILVPIWMLRYGANIRLHSVKFYSFWHGIYELPPRLGETTLRFTLGELLMIPLVFYLVYAARNKMGTKRLNVVLAVLLAMPYLAMAIYFSW